MIRNLCILCLLLLPVTALAGCLQSVPDGSDSDSRPRYGLGLNTANPPARGEFIEPAADVERFAQFLATWGPDMLEKCGGSRDDEGFKALMGEKWYLSALGAVIDWCEDYMGSGLETIVRDDYYNGREIEVIGRLLVDKEKILNETIDIISSIPITSNSVDIEVLGAIMRKVKWLASSFHTAIEIKNDYNPNRTTHNLYTVYTVMDIYENLSNPSQAQPVLLDLINNYPWSEQECRLDPQRVERIYEDANTLLANVIAKAESLRSPDADDMHLGTNYGRLLLDYTPGMAFFEDNGWWPGTLWYQAILEWSDSGWDHHNDEVLPSQEESIYLVEVYLNQSRSLMTDEQVSILIGNLPYRDWDREPEWANTVVSLPDFRWTYGDLPCQ